MPDTAPALTGEQIDEGIDFTTDVVADVLSSLLHEIGWDSMDPYWEWLAAVVARAKREAAEEIAAALKAAATSLGDRDSLDSGARALRNGLMLGAQLALPDALDALLRERAR